MSPADVGAFNLDEYKQYMSTYWDVKKRDTTLLRNAMLNALVNVEKQKSKKHSKIIEMFEDDIDGVKSLKDTKRERNEIFGEGGVV